MLITERFTLPSNYKIELAQKLVPWGFGPFSEAVYYRTYSRMVNNRQERWADTVIRVVEGVISIRKDWYKKIGVQWDEDRWNIIAIKLADAIFSMKMLPPGRGLWAMGTDYVFGRGSAALNNCGFVDVTENLSEAAAWTMDHLMCGVGVGFSTQNAKFQAFSLPNPSHLRPYVLPDSREGWVEATRKIIESFEFGGPTPLLDYKLIRSEGSLIKGFGGVASGPAPLIKLHERLRSYLTDAAEGRKSSTRLIVDVFNAIGACVVAGNVRRSAELASGHIQDEEFLNLKNYDRYPERREIGWMSNNSVVLTKAEDFEQLPILAEYIRDNGEPGVINMINVQKYGRFGKKKLDLATGFNPCAEIPLESYELCNLVEVFPTRCDSKEEVWRIMELATTYASTVALLPSHDSKTNRVMARNRRIGVSVSGVADLVDSTNISAVTRLLREGYEQHVEPTNKLMAEEAGVPPSVRLTTVKPSGTISQLAGVSPGMHWPIFRHGIRRMRVSMTSPVAAVLQKAGVPCEEDKYSDRTWVFEFPLASGNGVRPVSEVSVWEQASLLAMLQREWADNAVSNTLSFSPEKEGHQIERVIAAFAPVIKSLSLLPSQTDRKSYVQLPYEEISELEYHTRIAAIHPIDWSVLTGSDGQDSRFCSNDACELVSAK